MPEETKEKKCQWFECNRIFENDDEKLDHYAKEHIHLWCEDCDDEMFQNINDALQHGRDVHSLSVEETRCEKCREMGICLVDNGCGGVCDHNVEAFMAMVTASVIQLRNMEDENHHEK